MSITNLQIATAKGFANLETPTVFEKVQLVKIYMMGYNSKNPSMTYQAVRGLEESHPIYFNDLLQEAINHFKDTKQIR